MFCEFSFENDEERQEIVVSIKDKLEALKRIDQGETLEKIAADYSVAETAVGDWRQYRNKIEQFSSVECVNILLSNRKSMKESGYDEQVKPFFIGLVNSVKKEVPSQVPFRKKPCLS